MKAYISAAEAFSRKGYYSLVVFDGDQEAFEETGAASSVQEARERAFFSLLNWSKVNRARVSLVLRPETEEALRPLIEKTVALNVEKSSDTNQKGFLACERCLESLSEGESLNVDGAL